MPKQSTRHKYKTRREKNIENKRVFRILFYGGLVLAVLMLIRHWEDLYHHFKVYFVS